MYFSKKLILSHPWWVALCFFAISAISSLKHIFGVSTPVYLWVQSWHKFSLCMSVKSLIISTINNAIDCLQVQNWRQYQSYQYCTLKIVISTQSIHPKNFYYDDIKNLMLHGISIFTITVYIPYTFMFRILKLHSTCSAIFQL